MQDYRLRARTPATVPGRLTLSRTCVRSYYTTDYEPELLPLRRGWHSKGPAPGLSTTAFMRDLLAYGSIIRVVDRIPGAPFAAMTAIPHDRVPQLPTIRHPQDVVRKPENGMLGGVGTVPFLYLCYSAALLPRRDRETHRSEARSPKLDRGRRCRIFFHCGSTKSQNLANGWKHNVTSHSFPNDLRFERNISDSRSLDLK
ncbi:hypothetical protein EV424DRAFT_296205 [Suillus variegatus]|nr:hypothetical protein EV424DRAFT_296205 [Suillus variegatus]